MGTGQMGTWIIGYTYIVDKSNEISCILLSNDQGVINTTETFN